ncbi:MAG: DUF512 domain-containing protein [Oscillospiraceae bacterium]|nr:DUF512 domain-containing protein [Oscillospiraceae bacterium]
MRISSVSGVSRRAGVLIGEALVSVNGQPVRDILDVHYQTYERELRLELRAPDGDARFVLLRHDEGGDIGLSFEEDLPGGGQTCVNNCIFCFIDQNPKGCRASLRVKDDDARLSFLQGNYITLTNLSRDELNRICEYKISPLGISVHTTDPALRERMLRSKQVGNCLSIMRRLADAGVKMNAQIVLCPTVNDGEHLIRTLNDLQTLGDALISTSIVPVGLTKHRAGLTYLHPVSKEDALAAVEAAESFLNVWCSDEILLRAGLPIPPAEYYMDFPQLENGVGMLSLFMDDWNSLRHFVPPPSAREAKPSSQRRVSAKPTGGESRPQAAGGVTIATGFAAAPMLTELLKPTPNVTVVPIENRFFGKTVDVAGLLTGSDLLHGLQGKDLGERVLIPSSMLRRGEDIFLDDMTVNALSEKLGVPVEPVEPDAEGLWRALYDTYGVGLSDGKQE